MNLSKLSKLTHKLQKSTVITQKIGKLLTKIDDEIKNTPFKAIESLNKLITPKRNLDMTIEFYTTVLSTQELFEKENQTLKAIIKKINDKKFKANNLSLEMDALNSYKIIQNGIKKLSIYNEIKIVRILMQDEQPHLDQTLFTLSLSFFKYLKRFLPKLIDDSKILLSFLMNNFEKTEFFKEYTNVFYSKFSYEKLNKEELLARLDKLEDDIEEIKETNEFLLPENIMKIINMELESNIILKLKEKVLKLLVVLQKENNYAEIEFLGSLYSKIYLIKARLQTKELERETLKLINNFLLTYFQELDNLNGPNKKLHEEKLTRITITIIRTFQTQEKMCEKFLKKYKSLFNVEDKESLIRKVALGLYNKIHTLSEPLKNTYKIQYLLNNIFYLQKEIKTIDNIDLVAESQKLTMDFLDTWKSQIISKDREEAINLVRSKITAQGAFKIPSELRDYIIDHIKKIVKKVIKDYKKEDLDFESLFLP